MLFRSGRTRSRPSRNAQSRGIKSYFDIERKLYENPRNAEDYAAASPEYVFWVQLCKTARDRRNEAMSIAGRKRKTEDRKGRGWGKGVDPGGRRRRKNNNYTQVACKPPLHLAVRAQ